MIYSIMRHMATMNEKEALYDKLLLELRRGVLMLAVLSQLQDEQYGYSLKQSLDAKGMEINEGTLYPLLRRLEGQGLLESDWLVVDDARPRRYYKMSQEGETVFANLTQEWQALVVVMNELLGLKSK
ncbi:PadR family transcriptional regulator [Candidatus Leptofilum sp.]|uniref:PadR family transcriptional regulator n=1 Tax=Candidatus Leptofilum sp. TaxID=3241576 RepID=UPI003B5B8EA3